MGRRVLYFTAAAARYLSEEPLGFPTKPHPKDVTGLDSRLPSFREPSPLWQRCGRRNSISLLLLQAVGAGGHARHLQHVRACSELAAEHGSPPLPPPPAAAGVPPPPTCRRPPSAPPLCRVLEVTDGAQCSYASVFTLQQIYQQVVRAPLFVGAAAAAEWPPHWAHWISLCMTALPALPCPPAAGKRFPSGGGL